MEDYITKNLKKLILRAGENIDRDTLFSLRKTKALKLRFMAISDKDYDKNYKGCTELPSDTNKLPMSKRINYVDVTTWSSIIRNAVDTLKPQIFKAAHIIDTEEFRCTFENNVWAICKEADCKLNANCPHRLYKEAEESELIHSTVYMNSNTHFLKILEDETGIDWGLCAVYTGEIIIMILALLNTIHELVTEYLPDRASDFEHYTFEISYIDREDLISDQVEETISEQLYELDDELKNLEVSKDMLKLQSKVSKIQTLTRELFEDIEEIQHKYNLKTLEDLLK